jgi:hypothetical protein
MMQAQTLVLVGAAVAFSAAGQLFLKPSARSLSE